MKVLHGLLFALVFSLCFFACGSGNSGVDAPPPESDVVETPPAKPAEKAKGAMVEKTEIVPEAPVNDAGVDYKKLAKSVCACGAKYRGHDDGHEGDVLVSEDDTEYQKEVDCAMKAKNDMTKEAISRKKLVSEIKAQCHDLPGKLVMRLMMTLGE